MYTQCPECNTVFRITPEQLAAAGGRVRCGECHGVFNAQLHLIEQVPRHPAREQTPAPSPSASAPPSAAAETEQAATTSTADELDARLSTEDEPTEQQPATEVDAAAELEAMLAAEAESTEPPATDTEALEEAVEAAEDEPTRYDVDLDEFFATPPGEETDTAAEPESPLSAAIESQVTNEASTATAPTSDLGSATQGFDDAVAELDALLEQSATPQAGPEEEISTDIDQLFTAEVETAPSEEEPATELDAAAELEAMLAAEAASTEPPATDSEALDEAVATAEDSPISYDVDLDAFFSTPAEETEETTAPAAESAVIELDEFPAAGEETPDTATTAQATPASPADELFGEAQIESLLNSQDAETLELPWERDESERPAVVVDLAEEKDTTADEFTDLDLGASGTEVDEFDLPEAQLTSARPLTAEGPAHAAPLPELLATDSDEPRRGLGTAMGWLFGILLLLALLVAQYGYLNRDVLVLRYPQLRPVLEQACHYTGCQLAARRDLAAISLLERDIRSHDSYQGALVITATLVNRADFAQPYPDVEVIMRDLGGNIVAARRFRPDQYLSGTRPAQFAPGTTAQLLLEVTDPGAAAVGFEFNFY